MDAISGLRHWLDQVELQLDPSQKQVLMRKLAQGLRVRFKDRIKQQRDPNGSRFIPRKRNQIGNIKRSGTLFKKFGQKLKTEYSSNHASVGFGGRDATVAIVHQEGRTIRPSKNAKSTAYPVRQLVGFSQDDEQWIQREIEKFLHG